MKASTLTRISLIIFYALFSFSCASTNNKPLSTQVSVLQGLTSASHSQMSVVRKKKQKLTYRYKQKNTDELWTIEHQTVSRLDSDWVVDKFELTKLKASANYELLIIQDEKIIDQRSFQSLNLQLQSPRIAVLSCMYDGFNAEVKQKMWSSLEKQQPDLVLMIGDNAYLDVDNNSGFKKPVIPSDLWARNMDSRRKLEFFKQKKLIPTLAIWDDHDYGLNDGHRGYIYKVKSKEIFNSFWAQSSKSNIIHPGPGISYRLNAFNQKMIFLDNRSFRSPNRNNKPTDTHWGYQQEKWLLKELSKNSRPAWLIQGDQYFGAYHRFESYEGNHPASFKKMMRKISKQRSKVMFISGDRHMFEVMDIKKPEWSYQTAEVTSSGMHAMQFPPQPNEKNSRRRHSIHQKPHFVILKPKTIHGTDQNVELSVYSFGKEPIYSTKIEVK